jgi:hypothetical protein
MALTDFAFLVYGPDYQADVHIKTLESDSFTTRLVGVNSIEMAEDVSRQLVADGVQLIELCGWFGPRGAAQIIEAVGDQVPVGFVTHGSDSIEPMYKLFFEESGGS